MKHKVGIIMGSRSDAEIMGQASEILGNFGIAYEMKVVSAHRTPDFMQKYAKEAAARGISVIIAGAGGAAHLPGMVASMTDVPVIGVPVAINKLKGLDSLLSIAQMPKGIPVATVAIDGGANAGLLAVRILAVHDRKLAAKLSKYRSGMRKMVMNSQSALKKYLSK